MSNRISKNTIEELIQLRDKEGIDQMTLYERIGKLIGRNISRLRHLSNKEAKIIKDHYTQSKATELPFVDVFKENPVDPKPAIADIGVTELILESNGLHAYSEPEQSQEPDSRNQEKLIPSNEIPIQESIADRLERLRKQYNKNKK